MILVIDCGSSKSPDIAIAVTSSGAKGVLIKLADFSEKDLIGKAGVLISGAPILITEVDPEPFKTLLQPLADCNIPVLGICFGHQILGLLHGAVAEKCEPARATQKVDVLENDVLFEGISKTAFFREDHCEAITIPEGFVQLASSNICKNESMRHPDRPLWGVQFHPEVDTEDGRKLLSNFCAICNAN